jgi:hypothetical protein
MNEATATTDTALCVQKADRFCLGVLYIDGIMAVTIAAHSATGCSQVDISYRCQI